MGETNSRDRDAYMEDRVSLDRGLCEDDINSKHKIYYVNRLDPSFPEKLKFIPDPPQGLYVVGKLPDERKKSVAVIGSRSCSQYGRNMAGYFASALAKEGVQIISGLACGIDGIAQEKACDAGGSSFGLLAFGPDRIYPKQNERIFQKVKMTGGLISEYPPGTGPLKGYFAARNRLISGLCDILLVIEAKILSGTSITVKCALEQGKDIFVVPGRLTDPLSSGCNKLISEGAGIALSPEDILRALHLGEYEIQKDNSKEGREPKLTGNERKVYRVLDLYPRDLHEIIRTGRIPLSDAVEALFSLITKGIAKECGKNHYVKVR